MYVHPLYTHCVLSAVSATNINLKAISDFSHEFASLKIIRYNPFSSHINRICDLVTQRLTAKCTLSIFETGCCGDVHNQSCSTLTLKLIRHTLYYSLYTLCFCVHTPECYSFSLHLGLFVVSAISGNNAHIWFHNTYVVTAYAIDVLQFALHQSEEKYLYAKCFSQYFDPPQWLCTKPDSSQYL